MVVGLAVICDNCYQMHEEGAKLPGGGAIVPNVAKAAGAQSCGQCRHHQALVGAERARVGIRLGLHVLSKPDDDTGTSRGESSAP